MMEIIGYVASALIGVSLGLVGSGGSILTIPVLVYLFHVEPSLATAYSLFIVGITALVGGIRSGVKQLVDLRTTIVFAMPSLLTVYLTRRLLVPFIPHQLGSLGSSVITKDMALMGFFSLLMLAASVSMIRHHQEEAPEETLMHENTWMILPVGAAVGIVTGLVGAGGGFLIIPALILFARLPMKKAVGTSLLIIATNSLIGFTGDIGSGQPIDYAFVLLIAAIAVAGIFLGSYLSQLVDGRKLKTSFGWFVLGMGVYIIWKEFPPMDF